MNEREERAFDTLIVQVMHQPDPDDIDSSSLPELTAEERTAMDALPSDFIERILRGERPLG